MSIVLVGEKDSERTKYFLDAAKEIKIDVEFIQYPLIENLNKFDFLALKNKAVKLDPPRHAGADIDSLNIYIDKYKMFLKRVEKVPRIKLLNSVQSIISTLDKKICKTLLQNADISATPMLPAPKNLEKLQNLLIRKSINGVFIKHRFGSGAAGVIAYRLNLKTKKEVAYTSVTFADNTFYNTSKIKKITDSSCLKKTVNKILEQGAVVEQWLPKADFEGKNYDLRVVVQFGKVVFWMARQSALPITNLHLNDAALNPDKLLLSAEIIKKIERLAMQAVSLFQGLNVAGVDIMLHKYTNEPYIIEINAQGDLMYGDIFNSNDIYLEQVRFMRKLELQS